ncbi:ATP-dependent DNA ligase [Pseudofrankia asymbiotica]|uniref:ATP-dependent DNA ligase n=1 Tax=Pseudofrankia asymbiotica TaxID=1834516 RepID=A0A1V2I8Y3_9ACTN|nr:ATP-dependent DNA ligase [Pseudofrankia asymbiotica]
MTSEPGGAAPPTPSSAGGGGARRFVVQRHRARRPHYDLRFEIDGVLVSWAVPKGPTLDPAVRRMAVHVEDHPIEYLEFEGVIPAGQYGGGDVIVWDIGTWEPHRTDDPAAAVAAGELHADVFGQKLRGRLVLVRRGPAADKEQWLLLHKRDDHAVPGWDPEEHDRSVLSGRTNDEVRADPERLWHSDLPATEASVLVRQPATAESPAAESPEAGSPEAGSVAADADVAGPTEDELAALDALGSGGSWQVFGQRLRLTNLDKVLFPARDEEARDAGEEPVTKRDLVRYAARIAPVILPYLAGRPLNMNRFPNGATTKGFWHKELPSHAPDWLTRWTDPEAEDDKARTYLVADHPAALVWLANFGALEWHAWTSRTDDVHRPTYALIDIDPGTATTWDEVLTLARLHRTALDHLGLRAQPKLTGRRGLQIWIPVAPEYTFDDTRRWVEGLSRAIGTVVPDLVSWEWELRDRHGAARLDYTQNAINKTLVAPYSPRAAAGAPVSAPIGWDELDDVTPRPDGVSIRSVFDRLAQQGDPFRALLGVNQTLPALT